MQANKQERRRGQSSTMSGSTMGWISLLIMVSGVSAFTVVDNRISMRISQIPSSRVFPETGYVDSTQELYGRGIPVQLGNGALSSRTYRHASSTTRSQVGGLRSLTSVAYRNGGDTNEEGDDSSGGLMKWWKTTVVHEPPVDEKQRRVDDYLEFLGRRYNRLHDDERTGGTKVEGFSVLKWLKAPASPETTHVSHSSNDDALYVLGVAGLASERLLQKHHLSHEDDEVIDAVVVESKKASVRPEGPEEARRGTLFDAGSSVLQRLKAKRRAMIAYQARKLRAAVALALQSLLKTPVAVLKLWKLGGGRKSLAVTATLLAAMFVIVRPMILQSTASYRA